jgi:class 3 adenylate cyclase/tetratricopeptide (TPR) repeat protein
VRGGIGDNVVMSATPPCPKCGAEISPGAMFCDRCGTQLGSAGKADAASRADASGGAERRHITVLFCDLVDSTSLSERLDPEDLRDIFVAYRETCAEVVGRFGGVIARYVGDGILVLFGYPRAYEEDAISAVRVALGIIAAMKKLSLRFQSKTGTELAVHIGVHTGLVVAGEMGSGELKEDSAIVGDTPNIAARLEQLAGPNTVLITDATHRLLDDRFDSRPLGDLALKGVSGRVKVIEVLAERRLPHRILPSLRNRLLGREEELAALRGLWQSAAGGEGQVVLVRGDPGIGKSALLGGFLDEIAAQPHGFLVAHCARQAKTSALLPLIELLQGELHLVPGDDPAQMRTQLEQALAAMGQEPAAIALLAFLLSISPSADSLSELSSHSRWERTKEVLVDWLIAQTAERPLIFALEDLHWADASTIEFVDVLLSKVPSTRMLVYLSFRPEFRPPWTPLMQVHEIKLGPLSPRDTQTMIGALTGGKALATPLVEHIVAKTDGVPLFVEELTRMIIDANQSLERAPADRLLTRPPPLAIPTNLRTLLTARLDRLGEEKPLAQLASILGREFPQRLLEAVAPFTKPELQARLSTLIEAGFLVRRERASQTTYSFRHALIQEVAYSSLLRARRRVYHERIAAVLAEQFPELVEAQPELVAHHYALAERSIEATQYWRKAGERALERGANVDAAAHFAKGLEQVVLLPTTLARSHDEVTMRIGLGTALIAVKGYGASEVEETFFKALAICKEVGETPQLFPALRGLQSFYQVHGPLDTALKIGRQLLRLAENAGDPLLIVDVNRRVSWCLFCMGQLAEARAHLSRAREPTGADIRRESIFHGAQPAVLWLVHSAWIEWFIGDSATAVERGREALALARGLQTPISRTYSFCMMAALHQFLRDAVTTEALAVEASEVAAENGLPYWIAWANILRGWAMAQQGKLDAGMHQLIEGIGAYRATGAELFLPHAFALLAEIQGVAGRFAEGLVTIADALASGQDNNVHFFDAEIFRIKGELLRGTGDTSEAARAFSAALAAAETQGAAALERRARAALDAIRSSAPSGCG